MADTIKKADEVKREADVKPVVNTVKTNIPNLGITKANNAAVIYIGPNLKKNGLNQYTVFRDSIPKIIEENAVLKHLCVSIDELNKAMSELEIKGSLLNTFYNQALGGKN